MTNNEIIDNLNDPQKLEALYRTNPKSFEKLLQEAIDKYPESETLSVWAARLSFAPPAEPESRSLVPILRLLVVSLISFSLAKVPTFIDLDEDWYIVRFAPIIIIGSLIFYYFQKSNSSNLKISITISTLVLTIYLIWLPDDASSASIRMSIIHAPLILATLLSLVFMNGDWMSASSRIQFIRYCGETLIYTKLILTGGFILTTITFGLFSLSNLPGYGWYVEYVVVWGLISAPLVATYLYDAVIGDESNFASVLSNVFAPLFLITVVVYLIVTVFQGRNIYQDRDFLVVFNGLLLVIWLITVFSISGKATVFNSKIVDLINVALLTVTILINGIALSAIIYRLSEFGLTPNRFVVTGANLLIFCHLLFILFSYIRLIVGKEKEIKLEAAISKYLPAYFIWSLLVTFVVPVAFRFE